MNTAVTSITLTSQSSIEKVLFVPFSSLKMKVDEFISSLLSSKIFSDKNLHDFNEWKLEFDEVYPTLSNEELQDILCVLISDILDPITFEDEANDFALYQLKQKLTAILQSLMTENAETFIEKYEEDSEAEELNFVELKGIERLNEHVSAFMSTTGNQLIQEQNTALQELKTDLKELDKLRIDTKAEMASRLKTLTTKTTEASTTIAKRADEMIDLATDLSTQQANMKKIIKTATIVLEKCK